MQERELFKSACKIFRMKKKVIFCLQVQYEGQLCCCSKESQSTLSYTNKGISSRGKGVTSLFSVIVQTHLEDCASVLVIVIKKVCGWAEEGPEKGHKDDQMGRMTYEERLRKLRLFSLEKKGLGDTLSPCPSI